tara:strand:- start:744 stop:962 length:219 start_codon:yes stop_codon:yes gene_type:complete
MGINVEIFSRRGEDPKKTIKRFVKKCKREGFLREVIEKQRFKKSSEKRRMKKKKREKVLQKLRKQYEEKMRD